MFLLFCIIICYCILLHAHVFLPPSSWVLPSSLSCLLLPPSSWVLPSSLSCLLCHHRHMETSPVQCKVETQKGLHVWQEKKLIVEIFLCKMLQAEIHPANKGTKMFVSHTRRVTHHVLWFVRLFFFQWEALKVLYGWLAVSVHKSSV